MSALAVYRRYNKKRYARPEYRRYLRNKRFQSQYGITVECYEQMAAQQHNACLICGRADKKLCVDHCHTTQKVRGLLCQHCNTGLGAFGDNPDLLLKAIEYLKG